MRTDEELERLAADLESDRVERKESLSAAAKDKVGQAICAFANDLPGHRAAGVVMIGVRDDGTPAGTPITDRLLLDLAAFRSDGNILPLPNLVVEKRQLRGRDIAMVDVSPTEDPPVRYYGQVWIRVGPRRAVASRDEERVLTERRRSGDLAYDPDPPGTFASTTSIWPSSAATTCPRPSPRKRLRRTNGRSRSSSLHCICSLPMDRRTTALFC